MYNNTSSPKIIITGENGYIARHLFNKFQNSGRVILTSRRCSNDSDCLILNLEHPERFDYKQISQGDIVVHLASVSSPDFCAKNQDLAWHINVAGTNYFIEKCLGQNARVLFISSDTVYGSKQVVFNEDSPCSPVGIYGKMKHEVEKTFFREPGLKIFRLSYVFSKNDKFTNYLNNCLKESVLAEIFHPICRSVVFIDDVVDAVVNLYYSWDSFENNIFNICGNELLSRKDLANIYKEIVSSALETKIVNPGDSFFKARPKSIHMKSKYFEKLLGRKTTTIKDAFIKEFKNK